ncbi:MFS transporter [Paenibacillus sp. GP183]|uniref:MFS transporter n=1 Tax=Paenibacillus sp. GP183 TaxID=1882751 RepID=UPI00089C0A27|nr:MFS transporter [Paenibacillus sp. GP183]SEB96965.1 MFS transporter, YQGE family, putative transporter [Paenibacillus sp. GP183]
MQQEHIQHGNHRKWSGKLDPQSILLLLVNGLFTVASLLSGSFVGVYLWKAKNDLALLGWFALSGHVAMAVTFWLAGKWVKEHNKMNCLRMGVIVSALFYLLVLWLGTRAMELVLVLGVVQGIGSGFFWLAFNVVYFEVTNPENRDRFNGLAGLIGSGAGMAAPWISGALIVHMAGASGYRLIFTLSLGVFMIGVIVSFFLKKRKVAGTYEWLLPIRSISSKDTPWRPVSAALVAQGIREGVFAFLIGLMVYIATASEERLGTFLLITSGVSLISFWATGKWMKKRNRNRAMFIGALAMTIVILPFFWKVNMVTLLIYGIGTALFLPLYSIPVISTVFDLIGGNDQSVSRREEYIVLRELALNAGRMLGVLLFIIVVTWSQSTWVLNVFLLVIGSFTLVNWWFIRKKIAGDSPPKSLDNWSIPAKLVGNDGLSKRRE